MKTARHAKILEIIKKHDVETQEELAEYLKKSNFHVTQATVSRDIKELRLIKTLSSNGVYKYDTGEKSETGMLSRFMRIFSQSVINISHTGQLIIIHTLSGSANAAGEAVDALKWPEILGTIAGDNTLFVACAEDADINNLVTRFTNMIK